MAYDALKAAINAYIKQNGVRAITGQILNGVLIQMVNELGRGYAFMGAATPTGTPASTADPQAYFASTPGTYTNYGGIVVSSGELALLEWDGTTWSKVTVYTEPADFVLFKSGEFTWRDLDEAIYEEKAVFVYTNGVVLPCVGQDNEDNYIFSIQAYDRVFEFAKYTDDGEGGITQETQFTLDTDNSQSQQVASSEDLRGTVKLHKVSKTGDYGDLLHRPVFIAWFDETGFDEILSAYSQGCAVFCMKEHDGEVYVLTEYDEGNEEFHFSSAKQGVTMPDIYVDDEDQWREDANPSPYVLITGDLSDLQTTDKSSLVNAINEVAQSGGSPDAVLYTAQTLTDPQKAQARTNIGAGTYSVPAGGIPDTDLSTAVQTSLGLADSAVQPEAGKGLFSGNYNDLTNKPTIPAAQVNSDWNANSGVAEILNKPTIPTVESMTALEVATAVQNAWDAVMV